MCRAFSPLAKLGGGCLGWYVVAPSALVVLAEVAIL
jgi:hypothetical protein